MATKFSLMQQGVTNLSAEAVVNGTNKAFVGKDGICQKAGHIVQQASQQFLNEQSILEIGQTFITPGGALTSKHIIHVISPVWDEQADEKSMELLELCYTNALNLAYEKGIRIVAFPTISTGLERFPKKVAADCALSAVRKYVLANPDAFQSIWFVCAETAEYKIYEKRWTSFVQEMSQAS